MTLLLLLLRQRRGPSSSAPPELRPREHWRTGSRAALPAPRRTRPRPRTGPPPEGILTGDILRNPADLDDRSQVSVLAAKPYLEVL